jgi:hypothetical protein
MAPSASPVPLKPRILGTIALALICAVLPAWVAFYMFVIRPVVFQGIMSAFGWQSMTVPIALHVLVVPGLPIGLILGVTKLRSMTRSPK